MNHSKRRRLSDRYTELYSEQASLQIQEGKLRARLAIIAGQQSKLREDMNNELKEAMRMKLKDFDVVVEGLMEVAGQSRGSTKKAVLTTILRKLATGTERVKTMEERTTDKIYEPEQAEGESSVARNAGSTVEKAKPSNPSAFSTSGNEVIELGINDLETMPLKLAAAVMKGHLNNIPLESKRRRLLLKLSVPKMFLKCLQQGAR